MVRKKKSVSDVREAVAKGKRASSYTFQCYMAANEKSATRQKRVACAQRSRMDSGMGSRLPRVARWFGGAYRKPVRVDGRSEGAQRQS